MPAKKKPVAKKTPAKKAAAKAKKAAPKPSQPRRAPRTKKRTQSTSLPPKAITRPVKAPEVVPEPVVDPDFLGAGSVNMPAGRIRWTCHRLKGGVGVAFLPVGVRIDTRRISLGMTFETSPTGATSDSYQPQVEDRLVQLQFVTFPGWEKGFRVEVQGVDHAPVIG